MKHNIDLSVVIVNYKSESYLNKCLASIKNNTKGLKTEIIIVDNLSLNKNLLAKTVKKYDAKLLSNKKNLGFAKACNIGASHSKGKHLLFLNPDTKIIGGILSSLRYLLDGRFDIVGARLISSEESPQRFAYEKFFTLVGLFQNKLKKSDSKLDVNKDELQTDWVSAAAMIIKMNVFNKLNGFDESFFMYFEDQDLCMRSKLLGYLVGVVPEYKVFHYEGIALIKNSDRVAHYNQSLYKYFRKHRPIFEQIILKLLKPIYDLIFQDAKK